MFSPSLLRCATTQSIAAITCVTSTAPLASPAFTDTIPASGATPRKRSGRFTYCAGGSGASGSRPAAMPAMCVPWP